MSDEGDYEGDGSGSGEEGGDSDDESYDYGFAEGDDNEEEDEEYEVDYANMNVSPEILRMLGASEETIAAKEAEISGNAWVAPTVTGLEHSSAIANFDDVAIGGEKKDEGNVKRVFSAVGAFDKEKDKLGTSDQSSGVGNPAVTKAERSSSSGEGNGAKEATTSAVFKLKVAGAPQAVPKEKEHMLPAAEENAGDDDSSGSDTSWDEASAIDGQGWWETASNEDVDEDATLRMSPNLLMALGLAPNAEQQEEALRKGEGAASHREWKPPAYSGLQNSKPLTTLLPLAVGAGKGLEVVQNKRFSKEPFGDRCDGEDGEDDDWDSDEEGWDYEDVPEDEYLMEWSTSISPNLAAAIGDASMLDKSKVTSTVAHTLDWRPPATSGLANSAPIVKGLRSL